MKSPAIIAITFTGAFLCFQGAMEALRTLDSALSLLWSIHAVGLLLLGFFGLCEWLKPAGLTDKPKAKL